MCGLVSGPPPSPMATAPSHGPSYYTHTSPSLSLSLSVCIIRMYNICIYAIDMHTYADTSMKPGLHVNVIYTEDTAS